MGHRVDENMVLLQGTRACLSTGGKRMYILRSHLCALGFQMKMPVDYPDDDLGDIAFVKAASSVGGRDAVEEYLACGMHPLFANVSFRGITDGVTPVSWIKLPLPKFRAVRKHDRRRYSIFGEGGDRGRNIVGSYTHVEHDACVTSVPNGGRLNRMFELAGVA
jgi:hypothetical protein